MTQILEIPTKAGESVLVEIREDQTRERHAGMGTLIEKSSTTLETMLARIRPLTDAAVSAIQDAGPDEMTLEVGVNLTMEGSVIFASTSTGANFKVSMTWKKFTEPADGE